MKLTNNKTIIIFAVIIAAVIGGTTLGGMLMNMDKGKSTDNMAMTEEDQIAKLQAMTCEEFNIRNSNGVDYISSEVRDVAKDIRMECNVMNLTLNDILDSCACQEMQGNDCVMNKALWANETHFIDDISCQWNESVTSNEMEFEDSMMISETLTIER